MGRVCLLVELQWEGSALQPAQQACFLMNDLPGSPNLEKKIISGPPYFERRFLVGSPGLRKRYYQDALYFRRRYCQDPLVLEKIY